MSSQTSSVGKARFGVAGADRCVIEELRFVANRGRSLSATCPESRPIRLCRSANLSGTVDYYTDFVAGRWRPGQGPRLLPAEQRRLMQRFHEGPPGVLANYNVLPVSGNAPMVGAMYVARSTCSPDRSQQMIGHGLRGQRNGGAEEVLTVKARDRSDAFGTQLPSHNFDGLWRRSS